jgi:leucyl/phenylalanyl-tRNA--protein transferase
MRSQVRTEEVIPPELLVGAYCSGYFPMAESRTGPIHWYSPDPRAILDLDEFRVPRAIGQILKKQVFAVRIDTDFEAVVRACADRDETWISDEIVLSYINLHRLGFAHSVESWQEEKLVGGLYGVSIGGAFFGESMFHRVSNASSAALIFLHNRLTERGFLLHDVQFMTSHLARFGAKEIPRDEYLKLLGQATSKLCMFR